MKNADQPVYPSEAAIIHNPNGGVPKLDLSHRIGQDSFKFGGLTKRELIAAMAMQGILSARYEYNPVLHAPSPDDAIQDAIRYADELLKQLES